VTTSLRFRDTYFTEVSALYNYVQGLDAFVSQDERDIFNAISDDGTILFDVELFSSFDSLSEYIAEVYGSWAQVPESHPDIAIARAAMR